MAFNIVKGEELTIEGLILLLYGQPGAGKTSTALTAKNPIIFDFDGGAHRSYIKSGKDIIRINKWEEMTANFSKISELLEKYDTIIIDTVETCLDYIRIYIENQDYKLKTNTLKMYGKLKDEFYSFLSRITKLGKNVILIAHATTEEENGIIKTIPKITGGSKDIIRQKSDFVGYMFMQNNKRVLNFNPTDYYEGKNSAGFPLLQLPDYVTEPNFFADRIDEMKASLTAISKKQEASVDKLKALFEQINNIKTCEELNVFFKTQLEVMDLSKGEKAQAWSKTKEKGKLLNVEWRAQEKQFIPIPPPKVQAKEQVPEPATAEEFAFD